MVYIHCSQPRIRRKKRIVFRLRHGVRNTKSYKFNTLTLYIIGDSGTYNIYIYIYETQKTLTQMEF